MYSTADNPSSAYHKMADTFGLDPKTLDPAVSDHAMELETCNTDLSNSTTLTVDEISDPTGFMVVCVVMFLGDMSRGILFPTLWPLIEKLGGDEQTQGVAVAAFSLGRIMSAPRFGASTILFGYKRTLLVSISFVMLGMFMYAQTCAVGQAWYLILSQVVTGYGCGTLGVTRAFVADVTPTRNRTTYMAYLAAMQYAGFTVTPVIGSALVRLFNRDANEFDDQHTELRMGPFILNQYTAPAYVMILVCILTVILIFTTFIDRMPGPNNPNKPKSKSQQEAEDYANTPSEFFNRIPFMARYGISTYEASIMACMTLNVGLQGVIGSFETLGVAVAKAEYGLSMSSAGFAIGTCGSLGVMALLSMRFLMQIASDVIVIFGGVSLMGVGIWMIMWSGFHIDEARPLFEYVTAMFLIYTTGFPVGHTALIGLFSKLVGRQPQGPLLGWFASAGHIARVVFPIASGFIVVQSGYGLLFLLLFIVPVISLALLFSFKRDFEILSK